VFSSVKAPYSFFQSTLFLLSKHPIPSFKAPYSFFQSTLFLLSKHPMANYPSLLLFDTLSRLKIVGFWIQAEIAIVGNGLTSPSPRVDAPTLNILQLVFLSLSCNVSHSGQRHSRSFSSRSLYMYPQTEQVLDEGTKRPMQNTVFPLTDARYLSFSMKLENDRSLIFLPQRRCIVLILRVSKNMKSYLSVSSLASFQWKSDRLFATRLCSRSRLLRALRLLLECRCFFDSLRLALRMAILFCWKNKGDSTSSPLDTVRKVLSPKSRSFLNQKAHYFSYGRNDSCIVPQCRYLLKFVVKYIRLFGVKCGNAE